MSLIDEALKRARMEAAQRAAERESLPYPAIPRHQPARRRLWPVTGAVMLAAAVGIAAGLWLAGRDGPGVPLAALPAPPAATAPGNLPPDAAQASPAAPETAAAEAVTATKQESATILPVDRPALAAAAPDPPRRAPAPSPPAAAQPPVAAPPAGSPQDPPIAARRAAPPGGSIAGQAEPPAATAAAPAAAPITDPDSGVLLVLSEGETAAAAGTAAGGEALPDESYQQRYELPGGGSIELGGIAWSETGPFALINGRVVGPGSAVEEFTLERIGPEHVILSAGGRRIRIDLR